MHQRKRSSPPPPGIGWEKFLFLFVSAARGDVRIGALTVKPARLTRVFFYLRQIFVGQGASKDLDDGIPKDVQDGGEDRRLRVIEAAVHRHARAETIDRMIPNQVRQAPTIACQTNVIGLSESCFGLKIDM